MNGSRKERGARPYLHERARRKTGSSLKDFYAAVRLYAASVGTDDETYVRAFLTALNAGAVLQESDGGWRCDTGISAPPVPSASLLSSMPYAANARELYAMAGAEFIGGWGTKPLEHRDCVAIRIGSGHCCGALVAPDTVVTAAHCVSTGDDLHVLIGSRIRSPEHVVRVADVLPHPRYDAATHAHDIALLILEEEVNDVPCALIASCAAIDAARVVRAAGFGNNNAHASVAAGSRRGVHIPVVSAACSGTAGRLLFRCHEGTELVIGKPALARDGCTGESGAPCYVRDGNRWRLAGTASRPIPGYHSPCGDGTIYVRADSHKEWIVSARRGE